ncbi:hypothetical protein [[Ruminococcus] lactaris]|uniref:hypothetical protein n=1 Tax=[Ruminococcus] lactaris TaxID=46228 RepID=UPI00351FF985
MKKKISMIIKEDKAYYFGTGIKHIYRFITHNPLYMRGKYIITCRKLGYYQSTSGLFSKICVLYLQRKKNVLGEKLHIELGTNGVGAHAIGKIKICDDVQISSLSLVNKDITEKGLYGGIPVKLIK